MIIYNQAEEADNVQPVVIDEPVVEQEDKVEEGEPMEI